ncbi:UNKNOWN [Stylonychia lemnae]|uniref:GRAM domain-containing protein n=1 Tax=Stylonychia lemnae TaxID=5949 RepID=A0A077ZQQ3_STYLE|nr:UNKNOWN [Stylonychia lemnae]|eukprot:CDW72253.1 UNKNOWN [Stylonychia lemnae]
MADEEYKVLKKFKLDPDSTVLISKFKCMYSGTNIPVFGSLFILNDFICFSSFFNEKTLFGKKTKVKIEIKKIVLCEILNNFGTGILITLNEGTQHQFNGLGDDAQKVQYIVNDMMEGFLYKQKQKSQCDAQYIQQIELDMEKSAIENSLRQSQNKFKLNRNVHGFEEVKYEQQEQIYDQLNFEQIQNNQINVNDFVDIQDEDEKFEEQPNQMIPSQDEQIVIDPSIYQQQQSNDLIYIEENEEISKLLTRKWNNTIYNKTYVDITAAALAHTIFIHKNEDDKAFVEVLSSHMEKKDPKIKKIEARLDAFTDNSDSLEDILIHTNYALSAFYQGQIGIQLSRGFKERNVHVKTTLHKAIALIKVFPYVETQKFYVISPRKILMYSKLQMQKVFYSDHYYVDIFWDLDENLVDGKPETKVSISCDLVFTKNIPLIKKKIEEYYEKNLISSFNEYLKPQIESWIQTELLDKIKARQEKQFQIENHLKSPKKLQQKQMENQKRTGNVKDHEQQQYEQQLLLNEFNQLKPEFNPYLNQNNQQKLQSQVVKQQQEQPKVNMVQKGVLAQNAENIISNFIKELQLQTRNQCDQAQLSKILADNLNEAKGKILTQLIVDGIDVDLNNKLLNPDDTSQCNIQ